MSVILLLALFAAPAFQSTMLKAYPGDWVLYENEQSCSLGRVYEGEASLHVSYDGGRSKTTINVMDPAFASVKDGKKYDLKLYFVSGGKMDASWGEVHSTGVVLDGGLKGFQFEAKGDAFLTEMTKNARVAFFRDDKIVESLNLDRSVAAISALRVCASRVARLRPVDPFAD
ncbi:hypothetical protein ACVWZA_001386 [Sphingomonas sp. UYAg733]